MNGWIVKPVAWQPYNPISILVPINSNMTQYLFPCHSCHYHYVAHDRKLPSTFKPDSKLFALASAKNVL